MTTTTTMRCGDEDDDNDYFIVNTSVHFITRIKWLFCSKLGHSVSQSHRTIFLVHLNKRLSFKIRNTWKHCNYHHHRRRGRRRRLHPQHNHHHQQQHHHHHHHHSRRLYWTSCPSCTPVPTRSSTAFCPPASESDWGLHSRSWTLNSKAASAASTTTCFAAASREASTAMATDAVVVAESDRPWEGAGRSRAASL